MAKGNYRDVIENKQNIAHDAKKNGRIMRYIEFLIIQSIANFKLGNIAEALTTFREALYLGKDGGFVRIFLDEGKIVEVATPEEFFNNPQEERSQHFLSQIL